VLQILGIVTPIFAVVGLGKAAMFWKFADEADSGTLSRFTFNVLIPAVLFGSISGLTSMSTFGSGAAFIIGCLVVYGIALGVGRWLAQPSLAHKAVFALDATFGNAVFYVYRWYRRCGEQPVRTPLSAL
jgi:malonate transporter